MGGSGYGLTWPYTMVKRVTEIAKQLKNRRMQFSWTIFEIFGKSKVKKDVQFPANEIDC